MVTIQFQTVKYFIILMTELKVGMKTGAPKPNQHGAIICLKKILPWSFPVADLPGKRQMCKILTIMMVSWPKKPLPT
jgi:hypothetical protein